MASLLIVQRILPEYRLSVFRKLSERLGACIVFSNEAKGSSLKTVRKAERLAGISTRKVKAFYFIPRFFGGKDTACFQNILPVLWRERPKLVFTEFGLAYGTFWLLWCFRPFFRYRLVLWTHGFDSANPPPKIQGIRTGIQFGLRQIRIFIFRKMDGILFYSPARMRITLESLGSNQKSSYAYAPNTVDIKMLCQARDHQLQKQNSTANSAGKKTPLQFIFLGRPYAEKRLDLTVKALEILDHQGVPFTFHLVGPGHQEWVTSLHAKNPKSKTWFELHGEVYEPKKLATLLLQSHALVNPGVAGLSIVQALACGVPVVTFSNQKHGPEFDYLQEGFNSRILDFTQGNPETLLADALQEVATHSWKRDVIGKEIENAADEEKFLQGFAQILNDSLPFDAKHALKVIQGVMEFSESMIRSQFPAISTSLAANGSKNEMSSDSSSSGTSFSRKYDVALFARSETSAFARCFLIFVRLATHPFKSLQNSGSDFRRFLEDTQQDSPPHCPEDLPENLKEALYLALLDYRLERLAKTKSLSTDKAYLQLLCFSLSAGFNFLNPSKNRTVSDWLPKKWKDLVEEVCVHNMREYLDEISANKGKGSSGNLAMFQGIFHLLLNRPLGPWLKYHLENRNALGFWGSTKKKALYELIQNGYHQYEIFDALRYLVKRPINSLVKVTPDLEKQLENWAEVLPSMQRSVLSAQNPDSHFSPWPGGGGCHDYDATFLLTLESEFTKNNRGLIRDRLLKLAQSILEDQNLDGGFCESRNVSAVSISFWRHLFSCTLRGIFEGKWFSCKATLGKLLPKNRTIPTHWTKTSRRWDESNLWDTWFRLMTLARIARFFPEVSGLAPFRSLRFLPFPGIGFDTFGATEVQKKEDRIAISDQGANHVLSAQDAQSLIREVQDICRYLMARQNFLAATVKRKSDGSMVTVADFITQVWLSQITQKYFSVPFLGEESWDDHFFWASSLEEELPYLPLSLVTYWREIRSQKRPSHWITEVPGNRIFWTTDPIDATRAFVEGNQRTFAIGLSLIQNQIPIFSVIVTPDFLSPRPGQSHFLWQLDPSPQFPLYKNSRVLPSHQNHELQNLNSLRLLVSFQASPQFCEKLAEKARQNDRSLEIIRVDSMVKYVKIAEGKADAWVRRSKNNKEYLWDHAAGVHLLESRGGKVTDLDGNSLLPFSNVIVTQTGIIAAKDEATHQLLRNWVRSL